MTYHLKKSTQKTRAYDLRAHNLIDALRRTLMLNFVYRLGVDLYPAPPLHAVVHAESGKNKAPFLLHQVLGELMPSLCQPI